MTKLNKRVKNYNNMEIWDFKEIVNGDVVEVKAVLTNIIGAEKRLYLVAREISK